MCLSFMSSLLESKLHSSDKNQFYKKLLNVIVRLKLLKMGMFPSLNRLSKMINKR